VKKQKLAPLRQLVRLRRERGMTQIQLARRIGRSRALISLLERGYVPRSETDVAAIAAVLEVPREWLFADMIDLSAGQGVVVLRGSVEKKEW
jgi:transcriptional regulator with XRE-family HTH domain